MAGQACEAANIVAALAFLIVGIAAVELMAIII
jgi:hypothetical protein